MCKVSSGILWSTDVIPNRPMYRFRQVAIGVYILKTEKIKNNNYLNNYWTFPETVFRLDNGKQVNKKSIHIHLFKGCCDRCLSNT